MKINFRTFFFWILVLFLMAFPIFSIGEDIGLYYDSIFPDYIATQVLEPQAYQATNALAFPFLCQIYHGNIGVWITAFVILLTGTTSVLQHHLTNILLEFVILILIDRILTMYEVRQSIRWVFVLLLAISGTVMTISLTQYFIMLPGTIFILVSLLLISHAFKKGEEDGTEFYWFFSFFFLGLSFYSYFNYALFLVAGIVLFLFFGKVYSFLKRFLLAYIGSIAGAAFYFCGFFQIILQTEDLWDYVKTLPFIFLFILWCFCFVILLYLIKGKEKRAFIFSFVSFVILFSISLVAFFDISDLVDSLSVGGYYSANLFERIELVFSYLTGIIDGVSAEVIVYQLVLTSRWKYIFIILFILFAAYFIISFKLKKWSFKINCSICFYVFYILFGLILATRIQTQHFVPILFCVVISIALICEYILRTIGEFNYSYKTICVSVLIGFALISGIILFTNRYKVLDEILETGGRDYYNKQINYLAKDASQNKLDGMNEVYIFPEWGFISSFTYLTGNDVPYTADWSIPMVQEFLDDGYKVKVVWWYKDWNQFGKQYENLYKDFALVSDIKKYVDFKGDVLFCTSEFSPK